jgi:hypothetical protein
VKVQFSSLLKRAFCAGCEYLGVADAQFLEN